MLSDSDRLIRREDVAEILGVAISTTYKWQESGLLPAPIRIGPAAVRFRESELLAWLEGRPRANGKAPGEATPGASIE